MFHASFMQIIFIQITIFILGLPKLKADFRFKSNDEKQREMTAEVVQQTQRQLLFHDNPFNSQNNFGRERIQMNIERNGIHEDMDHSSEIHDESIKVLARVIAQKLTKELKKMKAEENHDEGNLKKSLLFGIPSLDGGVVNTMINILPYELHLPGYNYCGPGTKFEERIARGDKGINLLDEACKEHDQAYTRYKDPWNRREADLKLLEATKERVTAADASKSEKFAARFVIKVMTAKTLLPLPKKKKKLYQIRTTPEPRSDVRKMKRRF